MKYLNSTSRALLSVLTPSTEIIFHPVEEGQYHFSNPILLLARQGAEILHHLFEQRAHWESIPDDKGRRPCYSKKTSDSR
jgi:hypothetical protein